MDDRKKYLKPRAKPDTKVPCRAVFQWQVEIKLASFQVPTSDHEVSKRQTINDGAVHTYRDFFFPDTASVHTHSANLAANPDIFESDLQSEKKN